MIVCGCIIGMTGDVPCGFTGNLSAHLSISSNITIREYTENFMQRNGPGFMVI